ncbi:MAG: ester cyclase [Chloroflexi bacterium]|nr:ester cyclase [Chloroflexota bacterium]
MDERNEALVRKWLAAGDAGDLDAFDRCLHEDVVIHAPLGLSTAGIEAEKAQWRGILAGVPDLRHEVVEIMSQGASVAARSVVTGTHLGEVIGLAPTGRRFQIDHATFARVRDGKIAEIWEIADSASLLQQLQGPPA